MISLLHRARLWAQRLRKPCKAEHTRKLQTQYVCSQHFSETDFTSADKTHNINAPSHNTAKFLKRKLTELLQLPNTYNTPNSIELAHDLIALKIGTHHKCVTFDIKDLFTNIPITQTTKCLLKHNNLNSTITQYVNLLRTTLAQNYFVYKNKYYTCNKGVAMGSPLSNVIAETFLQHYEGLQKTLDGQ
jgi:hypothetical protein